MECTLKSIVPRYLRAIDEDEIEEFWLWLMPRWEKQYPQCFTFPYQHEYKETYWQWQNVTVI